MSAITLLSLILLILMLLVGGKHGLSSFISILLNFALLFIAVILMHELIKEAVYDDAAAIELSKRDKDVVSVVVVIG